jgi:protein gp37
MSKSNIEWTEQTWNPVVGCSILSPGCINCYAMPMALRIEAMNLQAREAGKNPAAPHYDGTTQRVNGNAVWTGKLALAPEQILTRPLQRKKPTIYFVNSMGDLFHEDVPDEWIDRVFAVMALCPQHTFQVLTKRAERMREYLSDADLQARLGATTTNVLSPSISIERARELRHATRALPFPNVWLGVSTERQKEANERIPHLLATPAAVRFISAEPLLGPIDLDDIVTYGEGYEDHRSALECDVSVEDDEEFHGATLDWVIVGGESGHGSRPMHPDWVRALRGQCQAAGVPFFFKQWGNWHPEIDRDRDDPDWRQPYADYKEPHFQILNFAGGRGFHGERVHVMRYVSKKSAGRILDGILHDEMPAAFQGRLSPVGKSMEGAST